MKEYSSLNREEIEAILRNICLRYGSDESPKGINAIAAELKTELVYPVRAAIRIHSVRNPEEPTVMVREIHLVRFDEPFIIRVPLVNDAA